MADENTNTFFDANQRLELSKMMKEYNVEDNTEKIRTLRHSDPIQENIIIMENLKKQYSRLRKTNKAQFRQMCEKRCHFLYNNYTNIFNRLYNDEINLQILLKFIEILRQIEDRKIDQQEGSYLVGSLLKKMYIDSALTREKKLENKYRQRQGGNRDFGAGVGAGTGVGAGSASASTSAPKNISWSKYKSEHLDHLENIEQE
jgi:hypothetical protein